MSKIRVCAECLRPVSVSYFIFAIGATCFYHGRISMEDTIKIPEERANYDS